MVALHLNFNTSPVRFSHNPLSNRLMTQGVQKKWDLFSSFYLTMDFAPQSFYLPLLHLCLAQAQPLPLTVLELGCGGARHVSYLLSQLRPGTKYVGVDISQSMVRQAQCRLEQLGTEADIQFFKADGERLPFPDCSFDIVIANQVIANTASPLAMAQEVARVLKKGGTLASSYWGNPARCRFFTLFGRVIGELGLKLKRPPAFNPFDYGVYGKVQSFLTEAGLQPTRVWSMFSPFNFTGVTDANAYLQCAQRQQIIDQNFPQHKQEIEELYRRRFCEQLSGGSPLGFDAVVCLARKQQ